MHLETIIAAAITGVLASLVTAFVNKSTADKKNAIENITQERKKWRDDLRGATVALRRYFENKESVSTDGKENCGIVFHSAAEAKAFFEIRLNLGDPEDCKLMAILDRLVTHDCSSRKPTFQKWEAVCKKNGFETEKMLEEDLLALFEKGMSHNLKFDWEKAKIETSAKNHLFEIGRFLALLGFICADIHLYLNDKYLQLSYESMQSVEVAETFFSLCLTIFFVIFIEKGLHKCFKKMRRHGVLNRIPKFALYCPCAILVVLVLILFVVLQSLANRPFAFVALYLLFKIIEELCIYPNRTILYSSKEHS